MKLEEKFYTLKNLLKEMESLVVAYSGGIDSTLLLKIGYYVLGEQVVGVTAVSASLPAQELEDALKIATEIGAKVVQLDSHELQDPRYLANTPQRCFFCKSKSYDLIVDYAQKNGYHCVIDGTNADDTGDHRPGREAARNHSVRSPLVEVGFTKAEVRALARSLGLKNWNKPAAACLSSRIPYGTEITTEILSQVEKAESVLHEMGFGQLRVRHHDKIARIEVEPEDLSTVLKQRDKITAELRALGYVYITLDLEGFRTGSLNETLV